MRYEVKITRKAVEETTLYVDADSETEAEEQANATLEDGYVEFDIMDSEYEFEATIPPKDHAASPSGGECRLCGGAVRWSGREAKGDKPLIPGPWVHIPTLTAKDRSELRKYGRVGA